MEKHSSMEFEGEYEEEADPILMSFINNLKAHGNSHVLDIVDEYTGLRMLVKYEEEEDDSSDEAAAGIDAGRRPDRSIAYNTHKSGESGQHVPFAVGIMGHQATVRRPVDQSYNHILDMVASNCFTQDEEYSRAMKGLNASALTTVCGMAPKVTTGYGQVKKGPVASYVFPHQVASSSGTVGVFNWRSFLEKCDPPPTVPYLQVSPPLFPVIDPSNFHSNILIPKFQVHKDVGKELAVSFPYLQKLKETLQKPYNHEEYVTLLERATERKPKTRLKVLRGEDKFCATDEKGKSYLDHYPDLAKQLDVSNCYRRLTLLRGLFFYLEFLCHEGAFPPWREQNFKFITYP